MKAQLRKEKMDEMQLVTVEDKKKKWDAKQSDYGLLKVFKLLRYPMSDP